MKTMLIKTAILALVTLSVLSFVSIFVLLGEAGTLAGLAGIIILPAVGLGSYRLAEKLYKACLATGKH